MASAAQNHIDSARPSAPHRKSDTDIVSEAALACLEQAGGEQVKAAEFLKDRVEHDNKLKRALLDPLVSYACHQALGVQIRHHRDRVWNAPLAAPRPSQREQMLLIAASNLMLFPLPGGKMLGDATREDVLAAASFYATQARDMAHKARWLKAVHDKMPAGKSVAAVLTEDALATMQKESC